MTEAAPAKPPRKKPVVLTPRQWAEVEALYAQGDKSGEVIGAKFGLSKQSVAGHCKHKGIKKGSKKAVLKKHVEAALATAAVNEATVLAARITETKEEHYKMASAIGRLTWNEILQAKKDGKPVGIALNNLKALDAAMTILKKAREERYAVLGLDKPDAIDPDEVPELVISELTAEEVQQLRDRDHTELDDVATNQEPADDLQDDDLVSEGS